MNKLIYVLLAFFLTKTNFSRCQQIISTVAGGAVHYGDNGAASSATMQPLGCSVDAQGNIYFIDEFDQSVRKIDVSSGIIKTVAGNGTSGFSGDSGPAVNAQLNNPTKVAFDANGNLYIADQGNHRVRKVSASTGNISTIAGNGLIGICGDGGAATNACLNPISIAVSANGDVYIAGAQYNTIRVVSANSGLISTIAGTGGTGYSGDNGQATSAKLDYPSDVALDGLGNLYIADNFNGTIRGVNLSTGIITTIAGKGVTGVSSGDGALATSASLGFISNLAVDQNGNILVVDVSNYNVRKITLSNGIISTVAGNGTAGFGGDGGAATSASLNFNNGAQSGISVDSHGNIFICDIYNKRIRKIDSSSGTITTVAGNGVVGYVGENIQATQSQLFSPHGVLIDSNGNLYVDNNANYRIIKIDAGTGLAHTIIGNGKEGYSGDGNSATNSQIDLTLGEYSIATAFQMALDGSDNLFFTDVNNNRLRMLNSSTGVIATVAGNGTSTYAGENVPATSMGFTRISGIVLDSLGNYYIADAKNHRVYFVKVTTGMIQTVAGNGTAGNTGDNGSATNAELDYPMGLALDRHGNLFICDLNSAVIRKVNSSGIITTVAGSGYGGLTGDGGLATSARITPEAVVVAANGDFYIADFFNGRIRKVTYSTGIITTMAGLPSNLGVGGFSGDGGPALNAELNGPHGLALDGHGNLYFADEYNNVIRKITNINLPNQTINFSPLTDVTVGDPAFTLTATASSGLAVGYASSSGKVTVNANVATIVSVGRDTITATQSGNIYYTAAQSVSQSFCINPPKPSVTESNSTTLSPTLTSSSSTGNQWYLNGTAITNATNNSLTITTSGSYTVQVNVDNCVSAMSDALVTVITEITPSHNTGISIYPNPARNSIVIGLDNLNTQPSKIEVFDMMGRPMTTLSGFGGTPLTLDINSYSPSTYVVRVSHAEGISFGKFVKQ
jgi:sugar lactone lactonase YvrE